MVEHLLHGRPRNKKAHGLLSVGFIRKLLAVPTPGLCRGLAVISLIGETELKDAAHKVEVAAAADAAAGVDPRLAREAGAEHQVAAMNAAGALHARFHFNTGMMSLSGFADHANAASGSFAGDGGAEQD
jgi:hypothetical protein